MVQLSGIANETIKAEIEEFLERPEEIERNVELFSRASPAMQDIAAALIEGDNETVDRLTSAALADGVPALEIMDYGLIAGMGIVGIKFREGYVFVPEVLVSARAMKAGMAHIEPILAASGVEPIGTVIMGTVQGDLHDIGKTIVATLLSSHGFEVVDLGVNVPAEAFVEAVRDRKPQFVGMSSLLTITAKELGKVIDALTEAGLRDSVKVIVGGGAVTQEYADQIGADGYGRDAELGVRVSKQLLETA